MSLRVGIDSYGLEPLGLEPLALLRWAADHGADGVQLSGIAAPWQERIDQAYLADMRQFAAAHGLYLEWGGAGHIPRRMGSWEPIELRERNRRAAEEAQALGARIVRSCSGGLMRWDRAAPATETLLRETAAVVKSQAAMLRDHGVVLAIELHFEFTTHELLRLFELCDAAPGDYLGVVLDTMNLLTLLEDPLRATERILPWVVATHVKDGGLRFVSDGLESFPTAIGAGAIDLQAILERLACGVPGGMTLSIEDHGGSFPLPIYDRRFLHEFPDLTADELVDLVRLARRTEAAIDAGRCQVTPRNGWPAICETRLLGDLAALRALVARIDAA